MQSSGPYVVSSPLGRRQNSVGPSRNGLKGFHEYCTYAFSKTVLLVLKKHYIYNLNTLKNIQEYNKLLMDHVHQFLRVLAYEVIHA